MKREKLIRQIKALINKGYSILYNYNIGDENKYTTIGNVIEITFKSWYLENGKKKFYNKKNLNKKFKTITKLVGGEIVYTPIVDCLGYKDSLRFLYHHYKWSVNNDSNCILVGQNKQIIAIQYNGAKNTRYIYSLGVNFNKDYIIINNKKKCKGKFTTSNIKQIFPFIREMFNKNLI